jgi:hypothetical protein
LFSNPEDVTFSTVVHEPRFRFEHGDHACVFYQSEDTRAEVLIPFMIEGLQKNEKCLCAETPRMLQRIKEELRGANFDVEKEITSGALELHPSEAIYLSDGSFRPFEQSQLLGEFVESALRAGFRGLRTAGDVSWAGNSGTYADQLLEYERMAEKCFVGTPLIGLCLYPVKTFPAETLSAILHSHNLHVVDPSQPSPCTWIQIREKDFVAEIITDKAHPGSGYSFIVRRADSEDVLKIGTGATFELAREKAERALHFIAAKMKPAKNSKK